MPPLLLSKDLCGEYESTPPHTGFDAFSRPGLASNLAVAIADRPGTDSNKTYHRETRTVLVPCAILPTADGDLSLFYLVRRWLGWGRRFSVYE